MNEAGDIGRAAFKAGGRAVFCRHAVIRRQCWSRTANPARASLAGAGSDKTFVQAQIHGPIDLIHDTDRIVVITAFWKIREADALCASPYYSRPRV
jgi:hypothetical protein